ncbi:GNAT family N-acetyltransferase [Paenibacillus sp. 3LSP]|uniref:GNAT family N-acetyltransferase n=1 Tax=Paenibacillus sp. 3LSP TaxID=2800795 RepID=UPI0028FD61A5|nr:GNAT family N-acetyltransferase [Paenibacillus sp. 3LSP]MDU0330431.1 GNAT family N-acetyltransferase [Paenibacillus sp. 3LSP]
MPIQYRYDETLTDPALLEGVWDLLCRYDHAFVPPLSAREHTYQSDLTAGAAATALPKRYFDELKEQAFLLVLDREQVIGFMSFRPHYVFEHADERVETIYVTTVIVDEAYRGQGMTTRLYGELEAIAQQKNRPIMTRTWSTNHSHIRVLHKIGMREVQRIQDGRGPGLDTVYYRKALQEGPTS